MCLAPLVELAEAKLSAKLTSRGPPVPQQRQAQAGMKNFRFITALLVLTTPFAKFAAANEATFATEQQRRRLLQNPTTVPIPAPTQVPIPAPTQVCFTYFLTPSPSPPV